MKPSTFFCCLFLFVLPSASSLVVDDEPIPHYLQP